MFSPLVFRDKSQDTAFTSPCDLAAAANGSNGEVDLLQILTCERRLWAANAISVAS